MAKKKKAEEAEKEENAERWLLSYADMMTLLVAFFIMMYSMATVNIQKFQQVALSVRSGFGGTTPGAGHKSWSVMDKKDAVPVASKPSTTESRQRGSQQWPTDTRAERSIYSYTKNQLAVMKLDETIVPILDLDANEGVRLNVIISDQLFFETGSAEIDDDDQNKLFHIGGLLKDSPFKITVEGYSSTLPKAASYQDSWQLSTERARLVALFLIDECKLNPRRISVIGHGEWSRPGKARRMALAANGEWKQLPGRPEDPENQNCVVISVTLK